ISPRSKSSIQFWNDWQCLFELPRDAMIQADADPGLLPREGRIWLVASGVLFLAGWVKGINLLMLLAYLLLALLAVNFVVALRQLRGLRGRRWPLGPQFAGKVGSWEVELTGGRRSSGGFKIEDVGPNHRLEWFEDRLESRQVLRIRSQALLPQRGRYG